MIEKVLVKQGRWTDLCYLYEEPFELLEHTRLTLRSFEASAGTVPTSPQVRRLAAEMMRRSTQTSIGQTYASLLARDDDLQAKLFSSKAMEYFTTLDIGSEMVRWALKAGQARIEHLSWLLADRNDKDTAVLRQEVRDALKRQQNAQSRVLW